MVWRKSTIGEKRKETETDGLRKSSKYFIVKNIVTGISWKSKIKGGLVFFFKVGNIKKYLYINGFNG